MPGGRDWGWPPGKADMSATPGMEEVVPGAAPCALGILATPGQKPRPEQRPATPGMEEVEPRLEQRPRVLVRNRSCIPDMSHIPVGQEQPPAWILWTCSSAWLLVSGFCDSTIPRPHVREGKSMAPCLLVPVRSYLSEGVVGVRRWRPTGIRSSLGCRDTNMGARLADAAGRGRRDRTAGYHGFPELTVPCCAAR